MPASPVGAGIRVLARGRGDALKKGILLSRRARARESERAEARPLAPSLSSGEWNLENGERKTEISARLVVFVFERLLAD